MTTTCADVFVEGLSVGYQHRGRWRQVLCDVTATARAGEVTALLGPNGTGKSTLLRTIAGLQPASSGRVSLGGDTIAAMPRMQRAQHVAAVLTDRVATGVFTARELVGLGRHPHTGYTGRLTSADWQVVDAALESVGASDLTARDINELSDGERQRVMIARALAQQPSLLLLDEPSAFLDAPGRVSLAGLLRRLTTQQGMAVVVSTHEVELALRTADWLWVIDADRQLHSLTPEDATLSGVISDVFSSPELVFDSQTAMFDLCTETTGTVAVSGFNDHVATRLLRRYGWARAVPGQQADATIVGATADTWTVSYNEQTLPALTATQLARWAQDTAQELHRTPARRHVAGATGVEGSHDHIA